MEEENYKPQKFDDCWLSKHPVLKYFFIAIVVFLGAFSAFYVVTDWHLKRMLDPDFQLKNMEKIMSKQEKVMNKMAKKQIYRQNQLNEQVAQFIHMEKTNDTYKIIIDLTPFDNDEQNIEVKTKGNTIVINAIGVKSNTNNQEVVKYNQAFTFGENVDLEDLTKIREGNQYIISIPIDK